MSMVLVGAVSLPPATPRKIGICKCRVNDSDGLEIGLLGGKVPTNEDHVIEKMKEKGSSRGLQLEHGADREERATTPLRPTCQTTAIVRMP
jgi:hypothetical protein